jgi:anti-sigma regulatory factor (Ser/Thr protein kinase)
MRMDFLRNLLEEEIPEPFERREAVGFVPCQHFTGADDYHAVASDLTTALAARCQTDSLARASIRICLDELAENVVHHADSDWGGYAAAQGFPRSSAFEIGIVDLGIGIRRSLTNNPEYADIEEDVNAIQTALRPRVTATPERNSGIGLFITQRLLDANGGVLLVRSGSGAVYSGMDERAFNSEISFPGTLVALRARTDRPLNINEIYRQLDGGDDG